MKTVCRLNSIENLLLIVVNYTPNCRAGNNVECGSGLARFISPTTPRLRYCSPLIVSISSLTRADGMGQLASLRQGAGCERDDQTLFLCLTQPRRTHKFGTGLSSSGTMTFSTQSGS